MVKQAKCSGNPFALDWCCFDICSGWAYCLYSFLLMVLAVYVASKDGIWLKSDNSEVRNVFQVAMYSTFDKKD